MAKYLVAVCAEEFGVTADDIMSRSRKEPTALARQMAYHIMRVYLEAPYEQIGATFGRCHSTILNGVKRVRTGRKLYSEIREHYDNIIKKL